MALLLILFLFPMPVGALLRPNAAVVAVGPQGVVFDPALAAFGVVAGMIRTWFSIGAMLWWPADVIDHLPPVGVRPVPFLEGRPLPPPAATPPVLVPTVAVPQLRTNRRRAAPGSPYGDPGPTGFNANTTLRNRTNSSAGVPPRPLVAVGSPNNAAATLGSFFSFIIRSMLSLLLSAGFAAAAAMILAAHVALALVQLMLAFFAGRTTSRAPRKGLAARPRGSVSRKAVTQRRKKLRRLALEEAVLLAAERAAAAAAPVLLKGGASRLTSDSLVMRLAEAVAKQASPETSLHIVSPIRSYTALLRGAAEGIVPAAGNTAIIAFDGPANDGHFYLLLWNPSTRCMLEVDSAPTKAPRAATRFWQQQLNPRCLIRRRGQDCGDSGCGAAAITELARTMRVRHPPLTARVIHEWVDSKIPAEVFSSAPELSCPWCATGFCCCTPAAVLPPGFVPMMMATVAALADIQDIENEQRFLRSIEDRRHDVVEVLGGAGSDISADRTIRDAPALSQAEIQTQLAAELQRRRILLAARGDDPSDATLVGLCVRIVFRFVGIGDSNVHRREWVGFVRAVSGTARSPVVRVEFTGGPQGALVEDDGVTLVTRTASLPPKPTDALCMEVLHIDFIDAIPDAVVSDGNAIDGHDAVAATSPPAAAAVTRSAAPLHNYSSYRVVADSAVELDASMWPNEVSPEPIRRAGDAPMTGADFLGFHLLCIDAARQRAPELVWCSVTDAVRRSHMNELAAFRRYLEERPLAQRLPLDVLLAHHLQIARVARGWSWSTLSRAASSIVGAFVSLPVYAAAAPSVNPARFTYFRALLQSARRLGANFGPREPEAATLGDVRKALEVIPSERGRVLLILAWFTCQRVGDILQLRRDHIVFPNGNEVRLRFNRGKVVNAVGAFHVHSQIADDRLFAMVREFVQNAPDGFLFPLHSAFQRSAILTELRAGLRRSRPQLELRSLRRGSLQELARAGCSEEQLLEFSRHTTAAQLRRYLGYGATPHAAQRGGIAHAAALAGLRGGGETSPEIRITDWLSVTRDGGITISADRASTATSPEGVDRSAYVLHSKSQTREPIDLDEVDRMARHCSPAVRDAWIEARAFLTDVGGLHSRVPWSGRIRKSKLSAAHVATLLANDNIAEISPDQLPEVKGTINVFLTPEDSKNRWRVIKHPVDFNCAFGREMLPPTVNATKHSARDAIFDGDGAVVIDLAAFFDQVLLDVDVQYCQAFRADDRVFVNRRLPMGSRISTAVGTALLRVLLDFPAPRVRVDWCTDSARFVGARGDAVDAAFEFVRRCRTVRAKANELDCSAATRDDVDRLWAVSSDYVGERLDFAAKTVRCRDKHIAKLRSLFAVCLGRTATYSQLFALLGMLYYCSDTLGLRVDRRLQTRLYFCDLARRLAADPALWRTAAPTRPPLRDLTAWYSEAVENRPAQVFRTPPADAVIFGDASGIGYGGLVCRARPDGDFDVQHLQRRWSASERAAQGFDHSTASEPEAACRLLDAAAQIFPGSTFIYVTDHAPFVEAVLRGFSTSPTYNSRIGRVRDRHPNARFVFRPGADNVADGLSRFTETSIGPSATEAAVAAARDLLQGRDAGHYGGPGGERWEAARTRRVG